MPSQNKPYSDIKLALRRSELPYLAEKSETEKRPGAAKGPSHCNYCCNYENCNIEFVELNNYDPPFAAFQDAANQYAIN